MKTQHLIITMLTALFFFGTKIAKAQQGFVWADTLGSTSYTSTATDNAGSIYITGNINSSTVYLKKYNSTGTLLLSHSYTASTCQVKDIEVEANGSFIYILIRTAFMDPVLWKLNSAGNTVWSASYLPDVTVAMGASPLALNNSKLMLGLADISSSTIYDIDKNTGLVIDSIRQQNVGYINSIFLDSKSNLYVTGTNASETSPNIFGNDTVIYSGSGSGYNFYAAKYDSLKNNSWANVVKDPVTFPKTFISADSMGNAYLAGELFDTLLLGSFMVTHGNWVYDFFHSKIDNTGQFVWAKSTPAQTSVSGDVGSTQYSKFLAVKPEGSSALSTIQRGIIDWGNGIVTNTHGTSRHLLCIQEYDANGNLTNVLMADTLTTFLDRENSIISDNNGNYFVAGVHRNNLHLGSQSFIVPDPSIASCYIAKISSGITSIAETETNTIQASVYPNPFSNQITISLNKFSKNETLHVINVLGETVYQSTLDKNNTVVQLEAISPGIYFLKISNPHAKNYSAKIIKH